MSNCSVWVVYKYPFDLLIENLHVQVQNKIIFTVTRLTVHAINTKIQSVPWCPVCRMPCGHPGHCGRTKPHDDSATHTMHVYGVKWGFGEELIDIYKENV